MQLCKYTVYSQKLQLKRKVDDFYKKLPNTIVYVDRYVFYMKYTLVFVLKLSLAYYRPSMLISAPALQNCQQQFAGAENVTSWRFAKKVHTHPPQPVKLDSVKEKSMVIKAVHNKNSTNPQH